MDIIELGNKDKGLQINNRTVEILQKQAREALAAFINSRIGYVANDVVVVNGIVITASGSPLTFEATAGVVYYNGEMYTVPAFPSATGGVGQTARLVISNVTTNYEHGDGNNYPGETLKRMVWQFGTSGSGIVDYNGAKFRPMPNQPMLSTKVVEIGDWNMDTTSTLSVAHGLPFGQIVGARVMIRDDANSTKTLFAEKGFFAGAELEGTFFINPTNVTLNRLTGGNYDSASYDGTGFTRGWILIDYIA